MKKLTVCLLLVATVAFGQGRPPVDKISLLRDVNLAGLATNQVLFWNGTMWVPGPKGDVSSNTSLSVDSELVLFSGTGGKTVKRATGTGIPKVVSGVYSIGSTTTSDLPEGSNLYYTDVRVRANRLDQLTSAAGDYSMTNHKITNLASPSNNDDAAPKGYVDSIAGVNDQTIVTTDNTTNNANTAKHGWTPKGDGNASHCLSGTLSWVGCGGGSGGGDFSTSIGSSTNLALVIFDGTGAKTGKQLNGTGVIRIVSNAASADATTSDLGEGTNLYYTDVRARANRLDQFALPIFDVSLNSKKLTNVAAPVSGGDAVNKTFFTDANIAVSDVTTNNVSGSAHGWAPKNDGNAQHFLSGSGTYTTPDPTRAFARVNHNTTQSILNATLTILNFNTELQDTDTMHDNVTNNSRLTCHTAGTYLITAYVGWASNSAGTRGVYIYLNGAAVAASYTPADASGLSFSTITYIMPLAQNDYVEVIVRQTSGASLLTSNFANAPMFSAIRINP